MWEGFFQQHVEVCQILPTAAEPFYNGCICGGGVSMMEIQRATSAGARGVRETRLNVTNWSPRRREDGRFAPAGRTKGVTGSGPGHSRACVPMQVKHTKLHEWKKRSPTAPLSVCFGVHPIYEVRFGWAGMQTKGTIVFKSYVIQCPLARKLPIFFSFPPLNPQNLNY